MEEDKIKIRQTQKLMFVHMSIGNSAKVHRHAGKDYEDLSRCLLSVYYLIKAYKVHLELNNSAEQVPLYKTGINNKWLAQILNILQQLSSKKMGIIYQKQGIISKS